MESARTLNQPPSPVYRRIVTHPWLLPPAWFLPFNGLLIFLDRRWPIAEVLTPPWSYLGWVPIGLGTGICLLAAWQFRRHQTTIRPFHDSSALITNGMFRYSRNPIYLGMVLAMLGVAINAGTLSALLVPPLFAIGLYFGFIRREETALAHHFGSAYTGYRRRVRRWV